MAEATGLIFTFLPILIGLVVAIFVITLFVRLVRAVEKIADQIETRSKV